jgi:phosphoribosylaminoimidazolecarboxamide formyltransferase / IMP cyclohydrolase
MTTLDDTGIIPIRRALLSVYDKTGIVPLARSLAQDGIELISTGGTFRLLAAEGIAVREVADLTGFPEMMDGRVKTLHPRIHGGLLAVRDNPEHAAALTDHRIAPIDLVVVNLYPFEETVRKGAAYDETVEQIDIGGPAMIRSAAKNHRFVAVVTDPADYETLLEDLREWGGLRFADRQRFAAKAFARSAAYDAAIAGWFGETLGDQHPAYRSFAGSLREVLRYGENPHQWAAFYATAEARPGVATARQVQGKPLSFNNLNDTDAAFELISEFASGTPAVAIIKHANPCGVATGASLVDAYRKALRTDPTSAFGGIVALNGSIDREAAEAIAAIFTEVIIAPDATPEALAILAGKKNLRVLLTGGLADSRADGVTVKSLAGGLLVQSRDNLSVDDADLRVVTRRAPTAAEMDDLRFAMTVAKHVKSNAIVYAKDGATVGIGAGQMSRVDSTRIAHLKSVEAAKAAGLPEALTAGSAVASDAFFPFADGLEAAVAAGATAVIQPGGSVRDSEVIAAADRAGIAMVFTGMRHFRH